MGQVEDFALVADALKVSDDCGGSEAPLLSNLTDGKPLGQEIPSSLNSGAAPSLPMPTVAFLRVRRRPFAH